MLIFLIGIGIIGIIETTETLWPFLPFYFFTFYFSTRPSSAQSSSLLTPTA